MLSVFLFLAIINQWCQKPLIFISWWVYARASVGFIPWNRIVVYLSNFHLYHIFKMPDFLPKMIVPTHQLLYIFMNTWWYHTYWRFGSLKCRKVSHYTLSLYLPMWWSWPSFHVDCCFIICEMPCLSPVLSIAFP